MATLILLRWSNFAEQNFRRVLLVQPGCHQTASVNRVLLAQRDYFLGHGTRGFRLGERGRHAFVFDEAANQVGKHRIPVFTGAAQLGGASKMSHILPVTA